MSDSDGNPMKAVWQSQPVEVPTMSISYVQHRNSELQRAFRIRNVWEQGQCVVALIVCGVLLVLTPYAWIKAGLGLLMAGTLFAMLQWRRRAAPGRTEGAETVEAGIVFYKRELERKREVHRTLWRWYLLPMVPGCLVVFAWSFFGDPNLKATATPWIGPAVFVAWITIAVIYERVKARQCQREIDALSSLGGQSGRRT